MSKHVRHLAREIAVNFAMAIPPVRAMRLRRHRTVAEDPAIQARRVLQQFEFFSNAVPSFDARSIAEIGPGDTIALAPLFIGAGAERYIVVDRFLGDVWGDDANEVYKELARLTPVPDGWRDRVTLVRGSIESAASRFSATVDLIVSFNVLEHLADLAIAFKNMATLLKPGGRMIHRIDYGPHDVWASYDNPLEFLTVPGPLWWLMGGNRGYPNRMRHHQVLRLLSAAGFRTEVRITGTTPERHVLDVKGRLCRSLAKCSDEELLVIDAELISRKTEHFGLSR